MSNIEWLTPEGFEKLRAELEELKNVKRPEMANILKRARAHGDFRENAEFDSAKHQQMLLENRIAYLEEKLARARIHEPGHTGDGKAYLGSRVMLKDLGRGDEFEYKLVSAEEADVKEGKISVSSPVGRSLLGLKAGDVAEIKVPAGTLRWEVLEVKY
ncbi:MAG: transcription elongation factor GreA [Candidatus Abyssubacteria bacterium]